MYFNKKSDSAVSPVIGVILMVAITVILAAVIGSFVLNLGGNLEANPQAGVTFDTDSAANEITVQVVSMDNADGLYVRNDGAFLAADGSDQGVSDYASASYTLTNVGDSVEFSYGNDVTVVGELEGKQSVLQSWSP